MIDLTNEEQVVEAIANFMNEQKGITITYKGIGENKYVSGKADIIGRDKSKNRMWCVEVKPEVKKSAKRPLHQRRNYFEGIICQIVTRMKSKNTNYAIGVPLSLYPYAKRNIPKEARKRLKLRLFLVNENGIVLYKSYTDW